jgi:hypothetical protein
MPQPVRRRARRRGATQLRDMLIAQWDRTMIRWRIPGHLYPYEEALKAGADVVVTSGRLARALTHAGLPADRFDDGGPDTGKPWLLGADDTLTEIRDEQGVAADRLRRGHQDGAGTHAARQRPHDAGHLRALVAGCRRVHPHGHRRSHRGANSFRAKD